MEHFNVTLNSSTYNASFIGSPHFSWDRGGLIPSIVFSFCFMVMGVLHQNKELSSLSQILMMNLAVSDLLCLITLPIWIYSLLFNWLLGRVACKSISFLVLCSIYSSMLTVTLLSLQRYLQVLFPYTWRRLGKAKEGGLLSILWALAMVFSIPKGLVARDLKQSESGQVSCSFVFASDTQEVAFLLLETLLGFVVPFSIITTTYICLHQRLNQTPFFRNIRLTKLVSSIIVTFFILWTPVHVMNVVDIGVVLGKGKALTEFCKAYLNTAIALTFINSCVNPFLYAFAARNSHLQISKAPGRYRARQGSQQGGSAPQSGQTDGHLQTNACLG
uniref:G-protein coupled receptors family 1 profile domain-containing protein n=1 Tax=Esox lucius TaxID=8010 RepID=A0AAY5JVK9_ESOLU